MNNIWKQTGLSMLAGLAVVGVSTSPLAAQTQTRTFRVVVTPPLVNPFFRQAANNYALASNYNALLGRAPAG